MKATVQLILLVAGVFILAKGAFLHSEALGYMLMGSMMILGGRGWMAAPTKAPRSLEEILAASRLVRDEITKQREARKRWAGRKKP